jgi:hypothetical protein
VRNGAPIGAHAQVAPLSARLARGERVHSSASVDINLSRLGRPEMLGMASGVLLVISTFLPWFSTNPSNPHSKIQGHHGLANAWQAFDFLQYALILIAIVPFILAWIVVRNHEVGWNRGELTAILGFLSLLLVLVNGIILGQPGTVEISLQWGYPVAILASIGIMMGGALRQYEAMEKQPPGV